MQPASANARACTGEGPATLSPSMVMEVTPETPENCRPPIHVRSATVGGLLTSGILPDFRSRDGGAGRSQLRTAACDEQPAERQDDEHVRQCMTENAVGSPRFGGRVNELAVRQVACLGHLV